MFVEHTHPLVKAFPLSHQWCMQTEIITINFGICTSKNKYLYVQTVRAWKWSSLYYTICYYTNRWHLEI